MRSTLGQEYMFSGPWNTGSPVHETITHLALKRAGLTNNKEYDCCKSSEDFSASTQKIVADASNREYLRGVLWNDDPTATLFDNNEEENWDFGLGVAFGSLAFGVFGLIGFLKSVTSVLSPAGKKW